MRAYTYVRARLTRRRVLIALGLVLLGLGGLWLLRLSGAAWSPGAIRELLGRLGIWGPIVLVIWLAAVLVVPVVPASVLQLGAGLAYGPLPGLALVALADALGAAVGFLLARRWGLAALEHRLSPESQQTLKHLAHRMTWRMVLLLRLLPGPAYPLVSFAAGCSLLRFLTYILASLAGALPSLALLVLAGDLVTRSPVLAFAVVAALVASLALAGRLLQPAQQEGV